METADYSKIAATYDDDEDRHDISPDAILAATLASLERPAQVLDLACGTGNYMRAQREAFPGAAITWRGLDRAEAMLDRARAKVPEAELIQGRAEALPYEDDLFDHVAVNFALHHFEDKVAALDELARVMRPGASLRVTNIVAEQMPGWWIYRFFPEARLEDEKRFWSVPLICYELERRGVEISRCEITQRHPTRTLRELLARALRRDVSELAILPEPSYEAGIARLEHELERAPDASIRDEVALLCLEARHRGELVSGGRGKG